MANGVPEILNVYRKFERVYAVSVKRHKINETWNGVNVQKPL